MIWYLGINYNISLTWNKASDIGYKMVIIYRLVIYVYIYIYIWVMLNFTRSWGFGIFRVYWVSKSKCIISSNLRAEGSSGKVLNVVIFVESVVQKVQLAFQRNWNSRKQSETVGNSQKQSETVGKFFFLQKNGGLTILAWSRRATADCFRLFPTVSVSLERQLDLWTTDSTKITTFNTFPDDPSARRLLEMMHFDFETQYTLKIPKPQDLVKFNTG